jgi:MerR family redox-sensitive transcriptional activator SoxR
MDLTIGDVTRRTGVASSALRYYESAGVLPAVRRVNGRRRYGEEVIALIEVVKFAQSVGFTLAEIRRLSSGFEGRSKLRAQWRPLAIAKLKQLDAVIEQARRMKAAIEQGLQCGCIRIEDCLPTRGHSPGCPASSSSPRGSCG